MLSQMQMRVQLGRPVAGNCRPIRLLALLSILVFSVPCVNAQDVILSSDLPHDVTLAVPTAPAQEDFDLFSWQSFVALNWPAKADGKPDTSVTIGQSPTAPRVWEKFIHPADVFLPGGAVPQWKVPTNFGEHLQLAKATATFRGSSVDVLKFPIVDQDKNYVLFDMRLNRDEFDYIVANQLYSKAGQSSATVGAEKFVRFPAGENGGATGVVEVKTAWRVFPKPVADPAVSLRYYTIDATVPIEAGHSTTGAKFEVNVVLGLIGFHIAHKTKGQPQWVWSTFEHVDNLAATPPNKPTLTDPACTTCGANNRPLPAGVTVPPLPSDPVKPPKEPYLWSPMLPFAASNQRIPTQAVRRTPITARTTQLNRDWQTALAAAAPDSVWQYYQLISTQWPTVPYARQPGELPGTPNNPSDTKYVGSPEPPLLANIPLETYNQDTSSCMKCHSRAFTTRGDYADFSYLLRLAQ